MDWTGRTTGFVVAVVLVVAGIALVGVNDDGEGPFQEEGETFEQDAEEGADGDGFHVTWWLGVGAIVVGVLLGIWAWTWGPPEKY